MSCDAFVLGGGGLLGAAEVGMAGALLEAGVQPDLVCGTSVGAINGAALAAGVVAFANEPPTARPHSSRPGRRASPARSTKPLAGTNVEPGRRVGGRPCHS